MQHIATGIPYLLVHIKLSKDFRRIQEVLVLKDPGSVSFPVVSCDDRFQYVLLAVPGQQRQIQDECDPVSVDQEKKG